MLPVDRLTAIIHVFAEYGRKMMMITNGYNLLGLDIEHLNKIQGVVLDDHGINHDHIEKCRRYLKKVYGGTVKTLYHPVHWNLEDAMKHPSNRGRQCRSMIRTPMVVKKVVYPCCNMYPIEQMRRDPQITSSLVEAGWTLDNPQVVETLRRWRKTLPQYVREQCLNHSWRPNMKVGRSVEITLKPHDRISAGEGDG